jgi:peptidoglycan/xylan/chitin deacetylase (PgdA/CDA1 family)
MRKTLVTTSWDDGHNLDLKVAALLDKSGLKGTFYISPQNRELSSASRLSDENIKLLASQHEVGAHTNTHPHLTRLDRNEVIVTN